MTLLAPGQMLIAPTVQTRLPSDDSSGLQQAGQAALGPTDHKVSRGSAGHAHANGAAFPLVLPGQQHLCC